MQAVLFVQFILSIVIVKGQNVTMLSIFLRAIK